MSRKHWLAVAVLFALAVGAAIVATALWPPTPGITYANFSRIELGMSRDHVEALLGPAHLGIQHGDMLTPAFLADVHVKPDSCYWRSETLDHVQIMFDADGRVAAMEWNGWSDDRTGLAKLRDRLPWIATPPPQNVRYYY